MVVSSEQREGLFRVKVRALARDQLKRLDGHDYAAGWGAALDTNGQWTVLLEVQPQASFGPALVLANRHGAQTIDLLAASDAGVVARQAQLFTPRPAVWQVDGTVLRPAQVVAVDAGPAAIEVEPALQAVLAAEGIELVREHGVVTGELLGVEVARVMVAHDGSQRLDVGVGAYDQGAFAVINEGLSDGDALRSVVEQVRVHRRRGAEPHPLNRLVRERWIRAELVESPEQVNLSSLRPVQGLSPRDGLYAVQPACAVGDRDDGMQALVACSVGVDLTLVPTAADLAAHHRCAHITFVLPQRDHYPATKELAARLSVPHDFVVADEPWA